MKSKTVGAAIGWKTLSAKYLFESPWHKIRQDQIDLRGKEITFTYLEHPGSVFVVPVTKNNEVVLLRTYRYPIDEWCWEIPAGGLGDKKDLSLEDAARAEMKEESGCSGGSLEKLGTFYTGNGVMDLKMTIFLARGVDVSQQLELEETEEIDQFEFVPIDKVLPKILDGEITDGESALALLLAVNRLQSGSSNSYLDKIEHT